MGATALADMTRIHRIHVARRGIRSDYRRSTRSGVSLSDVPPWTQPRLPIGIPGTGSSFIGRLDQLARFEELWASVVDGHRQVVFIGGEPGVGKTRLAVEIAATLHGHGAAVLWGSSGADFDIPYRPFVTAIDGLLASADAGVMTPVLGDWAAQLFRLTRQIPRHRPDLDAPGDADGDVKLALFDAVVSLLVALAERQPVVLVLEDLHWATAPTRSLLAHLVQSSARIRLLILVTHRTTAPDRSDDFTYLMADLYRHDGVERVDLVGLATEEVAEYLVDAAGMSRAAALRSAAVLRDQTGGNPFFLRELWRDLAAEGGVDALRSATFRAPTSVRDTLERRLAALPDAHAEVVELAAVAGGTFDLAVLLAASDQSQDVTLAAVDEGVGAGLFAIDVSSSGLYHFPHALARQAVLDRLPPTRRARNHLAVAQALERRDLDGPEIVGQLAHHYDMGHALGHAGDAVRYLVLAAEHAVRSLAHTDAARLYVRAADISADDGPPRHELLFAAARNHVAGGHFAEARRLYEHLGKSDDPDTVLQAAIGYENASWRPGMDGERAVELLEEALLRRDADPDDPVHIRGLASLGRALSFTGAERQARQVGEQAITLARRSGDDDLVAHALCSSLWRGMTPSLAPTLLARATELSGLSRALGDTDLLGSSGFYRAVFAYMQGLPDEWSAGLNELARAARAGGQPFFRYVAGCGDYARRYVRGELAAAAATVAGLDELGAEFGPHATEGSFGVQVFMLHRVTGELDRVRPLVSGTEGTTDHWAPGLLALYTELEMREPAARVLAELLDQVEVHRQDSTQWAGVLAFMVDAVTFLADTDAAARLRPLVAEYSGRNLIAGQFVAVFGSADRSIAQLDSLLGAATADEHFEHALDMDRRMGAVLHQVETLTAWSEHAAQRGDPQRAARIRTEARVLADRIGHRQALRTLDASTGRTHTLPDGLTEREVDVLRLVADGLSNREIGARLFISQNTAANHVRSILMKIGAHNRTQAAIYAVEHDLLDGPGS